MSDISSCFNEKEKSNSLSPAASCSKNVNFKNSLDNVALYLLFFLLRHNFFNLGISLA